MLLAAGLPLGTMEPLRGEGVRGLTVAVVRVAVESIPKEGDFDSWLMPANKSSTGQRHREVGTGWAQHRDAQPPTPLPHLQFGSKTSPSRSGKATNFPFTPIKPSPFKLM